MGFEARSLTPAQDIGGGLSFLDRLHARLRGVRTKATGFVSQPEPRTIGTFARGKQLIAGNYQFGGHLVQDRTKSLWEIEVPNPLFVAELHGFVWLDDLAAVADGRARKLAQRWVQDWITLYSKGQGSGWTADLTGRRVIRWINHAVFLMNGADAQAQERYFATLAHQAAFLGRRWNAASPGLPRFEALTGLLYAGLTLEGMDKYIAPSTTALAHECTNQIDASGGLPARNPEELLEVFTLLTWSAAALQEAGRTPLQEHLDTIERIAPTLRALRHADGGLARFHGGGRGLDGRLDHALMNSGVKARPATGLAMGYARLAQGRTTVITDASATPKGLSADQTHTSPLAFELTSGRRQMIVNCGSGLPFGDAWRRAGQAISSHSALSLAGSAKTNPELKDMSATHETSDDGQRLICRNDSHQAHAGLIHTRTMSLDRSGGLFEGCDILEAPSKADQLRFNTAIDQTGLQGLDFTIRFHLHPEVDATLDLGGTAVSMGLKSGEIWVFRAKGPAEISLEPSIYLETGRLKPRATKQIVLSGRAMEYATQISWNMAKAQDTPTFLRDVELDLEPATRN